MDCARRPPLLETERLVLRHFVPGDAAFIVALVNDPDWIAHLGDRGVRTAGQAAAYLERGPIASYRRHGFGLYHVALRASGAPVGMCGLVKRDGLEDADVGFALLPAGRGQGFAVEAARATLAHGHRDLGLERIVAIVSAANRGSIRVLERLGMGAAGTVRLPPDHQEVLLYADQARSTRAA